MRSLSSSSEASEVSGAYPANSPNSPASLDSLDSSDSATQEARDPALEYWSEPEEPSSIRSLSTYALGDWLKIAAVALFSIFMLLISAGNPLLTFGFMIGLVLSLIGLLLVHFAPDLTLSKQEKIIDWSILYQIIEQDDVAIAITNRNGQLMCANDIYASWFGGFMTPPNLPLDKRSVQRLKSAAQAAWRDGHNNTAALSSNTRHFQAEVTRSGYNDAYLIWHFTVRENHNIARDIINHINGGVGAALSNAGIMVALADSAGQLQATNEAFMLRAVGQRDTPLATIDFSKMLRFNDAGDLYFSHEGEFAPPVRLLQIPLPAKDGSESSKEPIVIALLDEESNPSKQTPLQSDMENLLARLPFGLGVVERDGRFLYVNRAFCRAAGIDEDRPPHFPSDIVVNEDKGPLADMIRRSNLRQQLSADLSIRLASAPDEPVSIRIIGVRGMGEASVLLSLKDSSEEIKLKHQVAQATKMQAVGQLAGGVAHDFNNILTAILGSCELMLMRHTPGDGDYDDIQQIHSNTNRAANLTRQLLAFSRQQTLRPQILQLSAVISEVSHLLKRLLGEKIQLSVRHGRGVGSVRADPGQLEQVIVNLAVNARDAMQEGGSLTIETFAVKPQQVADIKGSEIMPAVAYSALRVSDTGSGIPDEILSKIYEPFFTTKDVGEGTGLGLSTVYGIIKQSSGFIFSETKIGEGTSFVIYLPIYDDMIPEDKSPALHKPKKQATKEWGSGTILVVEDEVVVSKIAERVLTRMGYSVIMASRGDEGLEKFCNSAEEIDLVISDVVMPIMDGPTMVQKIREKRSDIPVLFMSGYAEGELRESINIPDVNFLPKPFSVGQLTEAVGESLAIEPVQMDAKK